jgi:hypothetical protein
VRAERAGSSHQLVPRVDDLECAAHKVWQDPAGPRDACGCIRFDPPLARAPTPQGLPASNSGEAEAASRARREQSCVRPLAPPAGAAASPGPRPRLPPPVQDLLALSLHDAYVGAQGQVLELALLRAVVDGHESGRSLAHACLPASIPHASPSGACLLFGCDLHQDDRCHRCAGAFMPRHACLHACMCACMRACVYTYKCAQACNPHDNIPKYFHKHRIIHTQSHMHAHTHECMHAWCARTLSHTHAHMRKKYTYTYIYT